MMINFLMDVVIAVRVECLHYYYPLQYKIHPNSSI